MKPRRCQPLWPGGFTLIELLVSLAIIAILMLVLLAASEYTRKTWVYTTGKIEQFRDSQEAFEAITRRLSQATLNTYWDYYYASTTTGTVTTVATTPTSYMRQSELRFISGQSATLVGPTDSSNSLNHAIFFQAPLGFVANTSNSSLSSLLNTWGYFVEFGSNSSSWPAFIAARGIGARYRFRLMEMMEPSDSLDVYNYTSGLATTGTTTTPKNLTYTAHTWFTDSLNLSPRPTHILAENVIALILLPKLSPGDEGTTYTDASLSPNYNYDSTLTSNNSSAATVDPNLDPHNQLPPVVQVTMVAVDEASYSRFQGAASTLPTSLGLSTLFQTVGDTTNPANPGYAKDLQTLQTTLVNNHINFRVFSTNVSLKAAKWSRTQTN